MTSLSALKSLRKEDFSYVKQYCEENVYLFAQRLQELGLGEKGWVVVISNPLRRTPFYLHRACKSPDQYTIWDYHVVYLAEADGVKVVFDFDSTLSFPCDAMEYYQLTFRPRKVLGEHLHPCFRVIAADEYLSYFASDRSHMPADGPHAPPRPKYAPIQGPLAITPMNLESYINFDPPELVDYDEAANEVGAVMERYEFELWVRNLTTKVEPPVAEPVEGTLERKEQEGVTQQQEQSQEEKQNS